MLKLKYILVAVLSVVTLADVFAQSKSTATVVRRKKADSTTAVTPSAQSAHQTVTADYDDAYAQWLKVIYRDLDLEKSPNGALKNVSETDKDLFTIILNLVSSGKIPVYEYIDGVEKFDNANRVDPSALLSRFNIEYDVPATDVERYYILERYYFDSRTSTFKRVVDAICPVIERGGMIPGEKVRYPVCWVKMSDLLPYIGSTMVLTDDYNNAVRHSFADFFVLNLYNGDIYKTRNTANKTLMQLYPDADDLKHARDSIEKSLVDFEKGLWTPPFAGKSNDTKKANSDPKPQSNKVKPQKEKSTSTRAGAVRSVRRNR